jgi:epoxyqueuosine reductase
MEQPDLSAWVEQIISNFWSVAPENSLRNQENGRAFELPLVGFSNGADTLYPKIKDDIGSFYMTPLDAFEKAFSGQGKVRAEELTVISWVLPHTSETKADSRSETVYPSERWARARLYGEFFNVALRQHVTEELNKSGFEAAAPGIPPIWSSAVSERYGTASNWSERHAAYVAGLGTFGLCDGLITARGKAMRCGSVVARIRIPASPRPYSEHHEYCLHFSHGACRQCIQRCPVGAITENGHDKKKCADYLSRLRTDYVSARLGLNVDVCGLCQTGVSCESGIPDKRLRRRGLAKNNS